MILKDINEALAHKQFPCAMCIVRSMCKTSCDLFVEHLALYLNLSRFNEKDKYDIADNILNENSELRKACNK